MSQFTGLLSATGLGSIQNLGAEPPDVTPNAVDWGTNEATEVSGECGYSVQQITGINTPITISTTWTASGGGNIYLYQLVANAQNMQGCCIGWSLIPSSGSTFTVSNNQYVHYAYCGEDETPITITVINQSDSNAVLDTFQAFFTPACLLTTTVVGYFGLQDNGPELTAMRSLREHYKNISGYQEIIDEYYQNSPLIIDAINQANTQETEYQYIYSTVVDVMNHVNNQEWQQAHDLYMAMYNDLKNTYLGM